MPAVHSIAGISILCTVIAFICETEHYEFKREITVFVAVYAWTVLGVVLVVQAIAEKIAGRW